eukprot:m.70041 g.70041  ORF g.70041 m.70041 type:complete len:163 (+) comp14150_c0_seq1:1125-1613(+)
MMTALTDISAHMLLYNPLLVDSAVLKKNVDLDTKCLDLISELYRISTTNQAFKPPSEAKRRPQEKADQHLRMHQAAQGTCLALCGLADLPLNQLHRRFGSRHIREPCPAMRLHSGTIRPVLSGFLVDYLLLHYCGCHSIPPALPSSQRSKRPCKQCLELVAR